MSKWDVLKTKYIDNGIKIIPILPNQKVPMIENWNNECSSDYFQILYWYEQDNNINFAIPCYENNLFVIDLDRHDKEKDGVVNFQRLLDNLDVDPCDFKTLIQETPSGGYHFIFKSDNDLSKVKGLANAFPDYPGIDLRNRNYIVACPSVINGKEYIFKNDNEITEMPIALKNYILSNVGTIDSNKEPYKKPTSVEVGDRDNQLFLYINDIYYKTRLDYDEILCLALNFNETILEKPFPEKTVEYKVKKAFQKPRDKMIFVNLGE